ncbi:MAG: polyamine aminopropyltransferase [Deltaproteobacteria bacterium]|nr:polyamine aminopropyltransferase [Deltaproteobacteria bacterium]
MDLWFEEKIEIGFGTTLRVRVEESLCHFRSDFQDIAVLKTSRLGRMLVLDGIIMVTEFDEFAYHEMMVHVPMLVHPNPAHVLIIGGGDGGAVREVLRHPGVKEVHLCEIDPQVVEVSKKYLPRLASRLDDPRVAVHYADGAKFVEDHPGRFDVIIVDSTDPSGPGEVLFKEPFYRNARNALTEDGIVVAQCESFFYHREVISSLFSFLGGIFPSCHYYYSMVPTYPSGIIGFSFGSKKLHPVEDYQEARFQALEGLRYYNPEVHRAAFKLPTFAQKTCSPPSNTAS